MNRFVNAVLLFLFIPTLLVTIFVGFDLPIRILRTSGANMPYREEVLIGFGLFFFIILLRRSLRRWMGMRLVSRTEKFKWNTVVSAERKKRVVVYTILEGVIMACAGFALYTIAPVAWAPSLALGIGALDDFIFTLVGRGMNTWRIGLSSKALVIADRDVVVLYFTGLRRVSIHQQSIYFDYIKGLQLSFPSDCIEDHERQAFFKLLEEQFDPERVYVSKKW